jgi:hypothetical protein
VNGYLGLLQLMGAKQVHPGETMEYLQAYGVRFLAGTAVGTIAGCILAVILKENFLAVSGMLIGAFDSMCYLLIYHGISTHHPKVRDTVASRWFSLSTVAIFVLGAMKVTQGIVPVIVLGVINGALGIVLATRLRRHNRALNPMDYNDVPIESQADAEIMSTTHARAAGHAVKRSES